MAVLQSSFKSHPQLRNQTERCSSVCTLRELQHVSCRVRGRKRWVQLVVISSKTLANSWKRTVQRITSPATSLSIKPSKGVRRKAVIASSSSHSSSRLVSLLARNLWIRVSATNLLEITKVLLTMPKPSVLRREFHTSSPRFSATHEKASLNRAMTRRRQW